MQTILGELWFSISLFQSDTLPSFLVKDLSHLGHEYGFSPVWMRSCCL